MRSRTGKSLAGRDKAASGILPGYVCLKAQALKCYLQCKAPSPGAHTQECTPAYSIHLNSGHLSGQILWGTWPQRSFCRLLTQQHWYECAYSMPEICALCSTLNFSKVSSALQPSSVARGLGWQSLPTQPCTAPKPLPPGLYTKSWQHGF